MPINVLEKTNVFAAEEFSSWPFQERQLSRQGTLFFVLFCF